MLRRHITKNTTTFPVTEAKEIKLHTQAFMEKNTVVTIYLGFYQKEKKIIYIYRYIYIDITYIALEEETDFT